MEKDFTFNFASLIFFVSIFHSNTFVPFLSEYFCVFFECCLFLCVSNFWCSFVFCAQDYLVSSSCDGTVRVWNSGNRKCLKLLPGCVPVSNDLDNCRSMARCAWQPRVGNLLAVPAEKKVIFFDRRLSSFLDSPRFHFHLPACLNQQDFVSMVCWHPGNCNQKPGILKFLGFCVYYNNLFIHLFLWFAYQTKTPQSKAPKIHSLPKTNQRCDLNVSFLRFIQFSWFFFETINRDMRFFLYRYTNYRFTRFSRNTRFALEKAAISLVFEMGIKVWKEWNKSQSQNRISLKQPRFLKNDRSENFLDFHLVYKLIFFSLLIYFCSKLLKHFMFNWPWFNWSPWYVFI